MMITIPIPIIFQPEKMYRIKRYIKGMNWDPGEGEINTVEMGRGVHGQMIFYPVVNGGSDLELEVAIFLIHPL